MCWTIIFDYSPDRTCSRKLCWLSITTGPSEEVPYLRPNSIKAGVVFIEETRYEFKSFVRLLEFRGL
jgi:hypothetical protein